MKNMCNRNHVRGMKVKVPVQGALAGLAGPHPLPPLLRYAEPVRVREGGAASGPCPAWEFWAGKGCYSGEFIWLARMAPHLGGPKMATPFGGVKGRVFWAGQFGNSGGRVNLASLFSGFFEKESKAIVKKRKECIVFCRPVILHHVDTV